MTYYDFVGRVRCTQTHNQFTHETYNPVCAIVQYDNLDRVSYTGRKVFSLGQVAMAEGGAEKWLRDFFLDSTKLNEPAVSELTPGTVTRFFYDNLPARDTLGVELYPASLSAADFKYMRGRLAATISDVRAVTDASGDTLKGADGLDSVIRVSTVSNYDKYGRVVANFTYDPTLPKNMRMLAVYTEYDLGGKVTRVTKYPNGLAGKSVVERYVYDRLDRVDTLFSTNGSHSENILATYEYYPSGQVRSIQLGGGKVSLEYTYHISGAVKTVNMKSVDGMELYAETLYYEDCGDEKCTPQYNGNISRMAHHLSHGNSEYADKRDVSYIYDMMNRLTNVNSRIASNDADVFDEAFGYDAQGRLTFQRRGENVEESFGGEYVYKSGSNKLKSVTIGMGGSADSRNMSAADNFDYDTEGNLISDLSKNMKIFYDWRSMPTEFKRRNFCYDIHETTACDSTKLLMAYDGSGRRVSKTQLHTSGNGVWDTVLVTHYTGMGTEVRENFEGPAPETKVVVNMPQGLGRYGIEDADHAAENGSAQTFEWYLKNHLGSTMLVYGTRASSSTGGVKAAYDYRSFGEQIELTPPSTGKVTENFTGKEHDEEIELDYFGARYLDPMLGMWTSVDPARQFFSPYLYVGNGYNPVNVIDPDGNAPYQIAVFVDILRAERNKPGLDGYRIFEVVAKWGKKRFGDDFDIKIIRSQKEMTDFVNEGRYTAIIGHTWRNLDDSPIQGFLFNLTYNDPSIGILNLMDLDFAMGSDSFAKVFGCRTGQWNLSFGNIEYGGNVGGLRIGDAFAGAVKYLDEANQSDQRMNDVKPVMTDE